MMLILLALLISVLRFFLPTHPLSWPGAYEAFAHLFVGGLLGASLTAYKPQTRRLSLFLVLALSTVELVAFFTLPH